MGFELQIGSVLVGAPRSEMLSYSVQEAATPLAAGDSSGQVGTFSATIPYPDQFVTPDHTLIRDGVNSLLDLDVRLTDTWKGFTLGKITSVTRSQDAGTIDISGVSRLGRLNVHNIQAGPFIGTLHDAFEYYLSLANITDTSDFFVDPAISVTPVVLPGWSGELWFHLKQMAAAMNLDISLVSGVILLRPIRDRVATRGRDLSRGNASGGGNLAQFVEVYEYNSRPITDEIVYPINGWSPEVPVINVNAGEYIEETLELSASLFSVQQPVFQTYVSQTHDSSSVYTVVGDDGLPITQAAWTQNGGRLSVELNPDTVSLTVKINAPTGLRNKDGTEIGVFGIGLDSQVGTGRYSTLRILGTGVAFDKKLSRIPTGASASETSTEVGVTIDNPFIRDHNEAARAAIWAAREYSGTQMTVSGTVVAVNQLGDQGGLTLQTYEYVQGLFESQTYASVQAQWSGMTYREIQDDLNSGSDSEFENQVFGNTAGARIWDEESRRWYRARTGTFSPESIQFDAEDDLTHEDVQTYFQGLTYRQVGEVYTGLSYRRVDLLGLRRRPAPAPPDPNRFPNPSLFPDSNLFPS